jgi:hypothetical protein
MYGILVLIVSILVYFLVQDRRLRAISFSRESLDWHIAHRQPAVFNPNPALEWTALKSWNPQYIAKHIPVLPNVYTSKQRAFLYFDYTKDSNQLNQHSINSNLPWSNNFTVVQMQTKQFFKTCSDSKSEEYVYFSGRMSWVASQFGPGERLASRDIDLSAFTFRDPKINMTDALEEDVHLWLGKKGVVACTHYDAKHNLYLQVFGRKRFEIAPPDMVRDCKPFPKFHPHARQCRESPRSMLVCFTFLLFGCTE